MLRLVLTLCLILVIVYPSEARIPHRLRSRYPPREIDSFNYNYHGIFIVPCRMMLGARVCRMLPFKDGYLDVLDCAYYLGSRMCNNMYGARVLIPAKECGTKIHDLRCSLLPHRGDYLNLENCGAVLTRRECHILNGRIATGVTIHPFQPAQWTASVRVTVESCAAILGSLTCSMLPQQDGEINMDFCTNILDQADCDLLSTTVASQPTAGIIPLTISVFNCIAILGSARCNLLPQQNGLVDLTNCASILGQVDCNRLNNTGGTGASSQSPVPTPPGTISATICAGILGEAACNQLPQENGQINLNNCLAILGEASCNQLTSVANGTGNVSIDPTPTSTNPTLINIDSCIAILGEAKCSMLPTQDGMINLNNCVAVLGEADCQQLNSVTSTPTLPSTPTTSGTPTTSTSNPGSSTQTSTATPCPITPTPTGTSTSTCSCTPMASRRRV